MFDGHVNGRPRYQRIELLYDLFACARRETGFRLSFAHHTAHFPLPGNREVGPCVSDSRRGRDIGGASSPAILNIDRSGRASHDV